MLTLLLCSFLTAVMFLGEFDPVDVESPKSGQKPKNPKNYSLYLITDTITNNPVNS